MSDTAYIVTQGAYSDYHIVAVFLDEDKAEHFLSIYNMTHSSIYKAEIEEYKICDGLINTAHREILVEYTPYCHHAITYTIGEDDTEPINGDRIILREFPYYHKEHGQTFEVFQFMLDIGGDEYSIDDEKLDRIAEDRYMAFKAKEAGI